MLPACLPAHGAVALLLSRLRRCCCRLRCCWPHCPAPSPPLPCPAPVQSCASGYEVIDEDAVYGCIGAAKPSEVRALLDTLLKRTFKEGYEGACARGQGGAVCLTAGGWRYAVGV